MARRMLKVRKVKKQKVSRAGQAAIDLKHLGAEPRYKNEKLTRSETNDALNWYNYMCTRQDARVFLLDFYSDEPEMVAVINRSPDWQLSTTAAWLVRLMSRGYELLDESLEFIVKQMAILEARPVEEEPKKVLVLRDKMKERISDILGQIDEWIDTKWYSIDDDDLYSWLQKNEIPTAYVPYIVKKFAPTLDELCEAYNGEDPQLVEGYSKYSKKQIKMMILFYNKLIEDAEQYGSNTKKVRAARKPKPVSIEKKLQYFTYQKQDGEYNLASVSPDSILKAKELWVFNTKYKLLTVFRAKDENGLDIHRSSIINFDEATSMTRRTGRKAGMLVKQLMNTGKVGLKTFMDNVPGEVKLQERINENIILLRVIK